MLERYLKINTIWQRGKDKKIVEGKYSTKEIEYLANNLWDFTEKVDGTNVRIMFDGSTITYAGKEALDLPEHLLAKLKFIFDDKLELFKTIFNKEGKTTEVTLYGEGYGYNIQKDPKLGHKYSDTEVNFVLFDIKIGEWWLLRSSLENIAGKLGIDLVPIIGQGTLQEAVDMVKEGFLSQYGDCLAEGIVAYPVCPMYTREGEKVVTKIKRKDYFFKNALVK